MSTEKWRSSPKPRLKKCGAAKDGQPRAEKSELAARETENSEPGTPAADLPDDTPAEVKQARLAELQAKLEAQGAQARQQMLGRIERVLVEGHASKDASELAGRTDKNCVVNFPGDAALIGSLVDLRITDAMAHTLRGELLGDILLAKAAS